MLSLLLLLPSILAVNVNEEILPDNCDCRDWYGACRRQGESWTDEETWMYECTNSDGKDANFVSCASGTPSKESIQSGQNRTIDNLWHSCDANTQRIKYETEPFCLVNETVRKVGETFREDRFQWLCLETGRWVVGCYYSNETEPNVLLKIGETGYNGLIKHVCDRFEDNPGRVQYHAEVRDDVHVKHPTNKGINKNFPEPGDGTIKGQVDRWTHESVSKFIANDDLYRVKIRYLPASRKPWASETED